VKVTVALRKGGASWDKAKKGGIKVAEMAAAIKGADIVMVLLPDEHHAAVYKEIHRNRISRKAARSPSRTASTSLRADPAARRPGRLDGRAQERERASSSKCRQAGSS